MFYGTLLRYLILPISPCLFHPLSPGARAWRQRCWSQLQLHMGEQAIAAAFYNDLVKNYPAIQKYFKSVMGESNFTRTIGNMNDVRKHASLVVSRLTNYMGNLHHLSEVNEGRFCLQADAKCDIQSR